MLKKTMRKNIIPSENTRREKEQTVSPLYVNQGKISALALPSILRLHKAMSKNHIFVVKLLLIMFSS